MVNFCKITVLIFEKKCMFIHYNGLNIIKPEAYF